MLQSKSSCAATVSATGWGMLSATAGYTTGTVVVAADTSVAAPATTSALSCASAFELTILFSSDIIKSRWFYFGAAKLGKKFIVYAGK